MLVMLLVSALAVDSASIAGSWTVSATPGDRSCPSAPPPASYTMTIGIGPTGEIIANMPGTTFSQLSGSSLGDQIWLRAYELNAVYMTSFGSKVFATHWWKLDVVGGTLSGVDRVTTIRNPQSDEAETCFYDMKISAIRPAKPQPTVADATVCMAKCTAENAAKGVLGDDLKQLCTAACPRASSAAIPETPRTPSLQSTPLAQFSDSQCSYHRVGETFERPLLAGGLTRGWVEGYVDGTRVRLNLVGQLTDGRVRYAGMGARGEAVAVTLVLKESASGEESTSWTGSASLEIDGVIGLPVNIEGSCGV